MNDFRNVICSSLSFSPRIMLALRALLIVALMLSTALFACPQSGLLAMSSEAERAVQDIDKNIDHFPAALMGGSETEASNTMALAIRPAMFLAPLITFGSMVAWGVMQAQKKDILSAKMIFITAGVGCVILAVSLATLFVSLGNAVH